jgi:hypothetical protein
MDASFNGSLVAILDHAPGGLIAHSQCRADLPICIRIWKRRAAFIVECAQCRTALGGKHGGSSGCTDPLSIEHEQHP